jgi:ferrous-iron efflux pump FieF
MNRPWRTARETPAVVAASASVGLAAVKLFGYFATGSSALLASAVDSIADVFVSAFSAWTVRAAGAPPDSGHPFGHGKFEHLGALVQAAVLAAVGGGVLVKSFESGVGDAPMRDPGIGLTIAAVTLVAGLLLSRYLRSEARRRQSPALAADAAHYASDWIASAGVLLSFVLETFFDWHTADHVVGGLIAAAVLRLAWTTAADAVNGLLDSRLAADELRLIESVVLARAPVVRGFHDLLTRRSGPTRFVQMHLEIDATLSFRDAHRLVELVVRDLTAALPNAIVTIHADPHPALPEDDETAPLSPR